MIRLHGARWPEDFLPRVIGLFAVRRRRAGRPQRSEDRTGPATSGSGRRPHLTRERKLLTTGADTASQAGTCTIPAFVASHNAIIEVHCATHAGAVRFCM